MSTDFFKEPLAHIEGFLMAGHFVEKVVDEWLVLFFNWVLLIVLSVILHSYLGIGPPYYENYH